MASEEMLNKGIAVFVSDLFGGNSSINSTTVEECCSIKGRQFNITAEEYAEDLLNFMKVPKSGVVG